VPPAGEKVLVFEAVLLNWARLVLGPLTTLHAPVPKEGALAARVTDPVVHVVWALPALAVVGTVQKSMLK
jgi:hypothetical protein